MRFLKTELFILEPPMSPQKDHSTQTPRRPQRQDDSSNIMAALSCPISNQLFAEPVMTKCGHTFEKEEITRWIERAQKNHSQCPTCLSHINIETLRPNLAIAGVVEVFLSQHPNKIESQYCHDVSSEHIVNFLETASPEKIVRLYMAYPEKLNDAINDGDEYETILHYAVAKGRIDLLQTFKAKMTTINWDDPRPYTDLLYNNITLLFYAIESTPSPNDRAVIQFLLDQGADPTRITGKGHTPLSAACRCDKKQLIQLLLTIPPVRSSINSGLSPLIYAVQYSDVECVQWLLAVPGIDINRKDKHGESALFKAAKLGDIEKVKILLALPGIDTEAKREPGEGKTAQQIARESGHGDIDDLFRQISARPSLK